MSSNFIFIPAVPKTVVGPAEIGAAYEGGYYFGSVVIDGNIYALVISPRAQGMTDTMSYGNYTVDHGKARSVIDGWANTNALNSFRSPVFEWARSQVINGFNDWYIPARDEAELMYRNLKYNNTLNVTGQRPLQSDDVSRVNGHNVNSYPPQPGYTANDPAMTTAPLFAGSGIENISYSQEYTFTSTESSSNANEIWVANVYNGMQSLASKSSRRAVRLIRRVLIGPAL